jgi:Trk K+ transport system NAD-binding subunit
MGSALAHQGLFIICGMGRLGQECARLLGQSAEVVGIDLLTREALELSQHAAA